MEKCHLCTGITVQHSVMYLNSFSIHHVLKFLTDVKFYNLKKKSFVSGLRIKYNINKPVNQRVVEVKVLCADCDIPEYKLLDDNKMYGIILSNFLLAGGDRYSMIRDHAQQGHIVGKVYRFIVVCLKLTRVTYINIEMYWKY